MFGFFEKSSQMEKTPKDNPPASPLKSNLNIDIDIDTVINTLDSKIIEGVKYKFRVNNTIELVNANIRNVLFCGASRSGKTTAFKILQDMCYCPDKSTIFSETEDTLFKTFSLKDKKTNEVHGFILNLIDSPGTFEIRSSKDEFVKRSNEQIGGLIVECLNHEVTYLNLIIMFVALASKVNEADIDSIELFMQMFGVEKSKIPILLCLTRADEHNETKRNNTIEEIKIHPRLKTFFERNMLEIIFMGCVDHKHKDYTDQNVLIRDYQNTRKWRENLLNRLFSASERIDLKQTNIYGNRAKHVLESIKICLKELKHLKNLDEDTSDYKMRLPALQENMAYVYKNKLYLDIENEEQAMLANEFSNLIEEIRNEGKIHIMKKKSLVYPWAVMIE